MPLAVGPAITTKGGFDTSMAIATLIAAGRLDDRLLDRVLGLLRELDPAAAFLRWIDERDAADLRFAGVAKDARWALDGLDGVDIIVQPEEPRWKRLLVADMDSTVIGQECIDELADYAGLKDKVAQITERAMQGELDFPGALRERVRLLAGLDERELKRCLDERVRLTSGAETLVQTMRAGGASCLLVSGGFLSFAEPVARTVGFDRVRANRLVFAGGKLSGEVGDPIVDAMTKREALVDRLIGSPDDIFLRLACQNLSDARAGGHAQFPPADALSISLTQSLGDQAPGRALMLSARVPSE